MLRIEPDIHFYEPSEITSEMIEKAFGGLPVLERRMDWDKPLGMVIFRDVKDMTPVEWLEADKMLCQWLGDYLGTECFTFDGEPSEDASEYFMMVWGQHVAEARH